jgi:hypothetical protein
MKKYQRKVNSAIERFNKGFIVDIAPYNEFVVKQFKRQGDRGRYEALWLIHVYRGESLVASKWLSYYDIVGIGRAKVGKALFWFVNEAVFRGKVL